MKRRMHLIVLGVLALALTAGPLMAGPSTAEIFKAMDKNSDSKVTAAEYMAACKQAKDKCGDEFKWFDRNGDGALTLPEFEGKVKN